MYKILILLAGGAAGTLARYGVYEITHRYFISLTIWATLAVNLLGAFLIGLLWGYAESNNLSPNFRIFIFIGLLGGFTTFSTYALDVFHLFKGGGLKTAMLYIFSSNILGFVFVFLGLLISGSK